MSGLMRMRLTPDAEKMVISTSKGFFMVIHDVNLDTMDKDLEGNILFRIGCALILTMDTI